MRAFGLAAALVACVLAFAGTASADPAPGSVVGFGVAGIGPTRPEALALDPVSGLLFFDVTNIDGQVWRVIPGIGAVQTPFDFGQFSFESDATANALSGIAFDAAGNLYVAGRGPNPLLEFPGPVLDFIQRDPAHPPVAEAVLDSFLQTGGLAVDAAGAHAYLIDYGNDRVLDVPLASPGDAQPLSFTGLSLAQNSGIALDAAGNLFVSDTGNNRVVELPAGGAAQETVLLAKSPRGLALDGNGDLFVALANSVVELRADGRQITLPAPPGGYIGLFGLTLDPSGNVWVSDNFFDTVYEIIPQLDQTIEYTSTPPSPALVGGTYDVTATGGDSGNPIVFSIDASSGTDACSITDATVTFTGVGACIVDAGQAGNDEYLSADQAQQTIQVTLAQCTPGTYSASGFEPCTPAPAGSYVDTTGATSATPCPLGSFSSSPGASSCDLAPAGSYVSTTGATSATPCALGAYQPSTGGTSCIAAPTGTYVATTSATSATPCPTGMTTTSPGSTSAAACHVTNATLESLVQSTFADSAPYLASLDAASASAARGNWKAAANEVGAFLNKLEAALNAGKITQAQFDLLNSLGTALQSAYSAGHNP